MGELQEVRSNSEQKIQELKSTHEVKIQSLMNSQNYTISKMTAEIDASKETIERLENELQTAKSKREAAIKDLRKENGDLTHQFMKINMEMKSTEEELTRTKEEFRKQQVLNTNIQNQLRESNFKRDEYERELRETREKLKRISTLEDELSQLRSLNIPEKDAVADF